MARLQRKKDSNAKKKKKRNGDGEASARVNNDDAAKKTALPVVALTDAKKRQVLPQKKALAKTRTEPGKIKSYINTSVQFLREVKVELRKVTWPTRKQTTGSTVVVIILVMIISLFLGVVDIGLSSLIRVVFQ
ncbi:MAG: preprotein translocase subunit SecE [Pseudomonadota bacterium]|uniref:Protein translocase subunit SecE n=1 Tax=Candidatus Desulfatibia profunda TaxID=2841695 RepID=A0A8J6NS09_9BACT|nr:preprotein translocase subunit SecE [Candidatus Desulfatibia profunda]MBL7180569.1 preprotein translocase subunit SecE [Desulfobacterales bacterium]